MIRRELLLVAAIAIGCVLVGATEFGGPVVRGVAAILLVCLLPGYALTRAMFPRGWISGLERATLAVGLSLATAALGAVLLNLLPDGIATETWALLLGGITLAACGVAARPMRRTKGAQGGLADMRRPTSKVIWPVALFGLAGIIATGAMVVAVQGARDQNQPAFAQLWLLPTADPAELIVGIRNETEEPLAVRLVITLGDEPEADWESIAIPSQGAWQRQLAVADFPTGAEPIVATLYRLTDPQTPFRQTRLWPP